MQGGEGKGDPGVIYTVTPSIMANTAFYRMRLILADALMGIQQMFRC